MSVFCRLQLSYCLTSPKPGTVSSHTKPLHSNRVLLSLKIHHADPCICLSVCCSTVEIREFINFSEQGSRNRQNKNAQCVCVRCGEVGMSALILCLRGNLGRLTCFASPRMRKSRAEDTVFVLGTQCGPAYPAKFTFPSNMIQNLPASRPLLRCIFPVPRLQS